MTENLNNKVSPHSKSYYMYMLFVLMLVSILDSYSTNLPGAFQAQIADELLYWFTEGQQNAIFQFSGAIVSIGLYFIFFTLYSNGNNFFKLFVSDAYNDSASSI